MLIIDMPMPVKEWNCLDCKAICADLMRGHYCGITKKTIDTLKNMRARPDWCPIKGVLPEEHGDLVDYDEVEKEFNRLLTYMEKVPDENGIVWFRRETIMPRGYTMKFHIIIPAERKDDGTAAD